MIVMEKLKRFIKENKDTILIIGGIGAIFCGGMITGKGISRGKYFKKGFETGQKEGVAVTLVHLAMEAPEAYKMYMDVLSKEGIVEEIRNF